MHISPLVAKMALLVTLAMTLFALSASPAMAGDAPPLSVTPITNDVVGLKSNAPTSAAYPNTFPVAARVCNDSNVQIDGLTAELHLDDATGTGATNINADGPNSIGLRALAPGVCDDAYFSIAITRSAASFGATRAYHFEVRGSGYTEGTNDTARRISVERLISNNHNTTQDLTGPGGCDLDHESCDPPATDLIVGNTYSYKLYGATSEQLSNFEASIDFPGSIFRVLRATTTISDAQAPASSTVPSVFNNACELQLDSLQGGYKDCTTSGTAGGNYDVSYEVRVIGAGSGTLKSKFYEGSGTVWHLNSDYGNSAASSAFTARWPINVHVDGFGSVTSAPAGISCGILGTSCQSGFDDGTVVTLSATPQNDEAFIGWNGACADSETTCVASMTDVRNVTAAFTGPDAEPLHVTVTGAGSVTSFEENIFDCQSSSGACEYFYVGDQHIGLVATPADGQTFVGWSGGGCTGIDPTCVVAMTEARNVTAAFMTTDASSYALSVSAVGDGVVNSDTLAINCGLNCTADFSAGSTVNLTALARPGSIFTGWSGACEGVDNPCVVSVDQFRNVTASFVEIHNLSVTLGGAGSGIVTSTPAGIYCGATCESSFEAGSMVTLLAEPSYGSYFAGWDGACSGFDSCTVTMDQAQSVSAYFSDVPPADPNLPQVSGVTSVGQTLSTTDGMWPINMELSFSRQWQICDSDGYNCSDIEGATGDQFELTYAQAGYRIRVAVRAIDGDGYDQTQTSDATATITAFAPFNFTAPSISGNAIAGSLLTGDPGGWSASPPATTTYQWYLCDQNGINCEVIVDATSDTYTPLSSQFGRTLMLGVTMSNESGASTTFSDATALILNDSPLPQVTGETVDGRTLTTTNGAWELPGEGLTFTYKWQECDGDGGGCSDIEGATSNQLTLTSNLIGRSIRSVVHADSGESSADQESDIVGPVVPQSVVNTVAPSVSGEPIVGETLTVDPGTWTGTPEITFGYIWWRCDNTGCANVYDAPAEETYTLRDSDAGKYLYVQVYATNGGGTGLAYTNDTATVSYPEFDPNAPVVSGTTTQGQTLTTTDGLWDMGSELTFTYQWRRCDTHGANCEDIAGATANTYDLTNDDVGHRMRSVVTADNGDVTAAQTSARTATVAPGPPVPQFYPELSGSTLEGSMLSVTNGTWDGTGPFTYTYQWLRCDAEGAACLDIADATEQTYVSTSDDVGSTLTVNVTAHNVAGAGSAQVEPAIGPIVSLNPVVTVDPSISGTTTQGETLTASHGTWTSASTVSYNYQWLRCDGDGLNCLSIDGATSVNYDLTGPDADQTIRVTVTAVNETGIAQKTSASVGPIVAHEVDPNLPVVSGTTTSGQTLTTSNGLWPNLYQPYLAYEYQWQLCDADGTGCANISGATSNELVLDTDMVGHTVRAVVTANDGEVNETQSSEHTHVIASTAPVNTPPVVSGTPTDGATLTTTDGTWAIAEPLTISYQWFRCIGDDTQTCAPIDGATNSSLLLTPDDVGHTIMALVVASNDNDSDGQISNLTDVVAANPPVNTALPAISGELLSGALLTAGNGEWTGTPTITFTYQWYRCNTETELCSAIEDATDQTYMATADDIGFVMQVTVAATNDVDTASALSPQTEPIDSGDPVASIDPSISGTPQYGQVLSAENGTWTSASELSYSYQWLRCDDEDVCADIEDATDQFYALTGNDVGQTIRVVVTATNATGAASKTTTAVGPVTGTEPSPEGSPEITGNTFSGQTLTVSDGDWVSYETPTFTRQWVRCDASGANCADVVGATSATLVLDDGDIGYTFKAVVTATNGTGSDSGTSNRVGPVTGSPLAVTLAASDVTQTSATLNGTIDARGESDSGYAFAWGTDPDDLGDFESGPVSGSGAGPSPVSRVLTGLAPSTTYYYRVIGGSNAGFMEGEIIAFTTQAVPAPAPDVPPAVDPAPTQFKVVVVAKSQTMENANFQFSVTGPGSGTFVGTVEDDKRHVGAEGDGNSTSGKTFTAFSRSFTENQAGNFELPAELSQRALNMIRERGFLRVTMTTKFTPSGSTQTQVYKQVVKLRPFAISSYATVPVSNRAIATLRTPRTGKLNVTFLLRNRATGSSRTIRAFSPRTRAGGSYTYSAKLSPSDRKAIGDGTARLMVKSSLDTQNYPSRMLRSRYMSCDFCG